MNYSETAKRIERAYGLPDGELEGLFQRVPGAAPAAIGTRISTAFASTGTAKTRRISWTRRLAAENGRRRNENHKGTLERKRRVC